MFLFVAASEVPTGVDAVLAVLAVVTSVLAILPAIVGFVGLVRQKPLAEIKDDAAYAGFAAVPIATLSGVGLPSI